MKTGSLLLRLVMVVSFLILAIDIPLAQTQQVTRTELQRVAVSDLPGREGVMYKGVFAPGAKAANHTHPGDEFVYVLKGTVTIETEGKAPVTLKAGDTFHQPKGAPHSARNGSTTEPAEVLVFMVVEPGKPLATAVE